MGIWKHISIKLGISKSKKHKKEGFTGAKGGDFISSPQKTMTNPARSAKLLGKKRKSLEMRGKDDLSVEIKERCGNFQKSGDFLVFNPSMHRIRDSWRGMESSWRSRL